VTPNESGVSDILESSLADLRLDMHRPETLSFAQVQRLSPAALAYIGDAVYELHVRRCYLFPPVRLEKYHQQVVAQVRAESQANHLRSLEPYLTSDEHAILKRGRNAASNRHKRVDPQIYQQATSLETLIGYLYLTDSPRLLELFSLLELVASPEANG
jgi:ribonuclease-3 family protein